MFALKSMLKTIKLLVLENVFTRKINIDLDKAIISFTFDDVPITAATNGAAILEKHNLTGTYYVALGIDNIAKGENNKIRKFVDETEVNHLHTTGHNIGCHTYSHINQRKHTSDTIIKDCNKNTKSLQNILNTSSIEHFSYPFGMINPFCKKLLRNKYKTLRTSDPGLNYGNTDMSHLRAINLYSNSFDRNELLEMIGLAIQKKAWLIFYTHDVCERPSEWGVTIDDFNWLVEQCIKSECEILPINHAYNKIVDYHS